MNRFVFFRAVRDFVRCRRLSQTPWCKDKAVKTLLRKHDTRLKRIYSFTKEHIHFQNDNKNFLTNETHSF